MYKGKKVLAIVPARGGSKGIKLKNLLTIGGKSLVALAAEAANSSKYIDCAIVSSDHDEIISEARKYNLQSPFKRPEHLSGDRISDWQVVDHALKSMELESETQFDIAVLLPPTSPFRTPNQIDEAIEKLVDNSYDAVWAVSETDSKGHPLKQLTLTENEVHYYDENGANIIARQQLTPTYHRNGAVYAMTRVCILNHKNMKGKSTGFLLIDDEMVNIDTQLDVEFAEFLFLKRGNLSN